MGPANRRLLALAAAVGLAAFTGCAQSLRAADYPDGRYTGSSAAADDGAIGTVEFTISGGLVTAASFVVRDADGTAHDESYGLSKATGEPVDEAFYQRAQAAVAAEKQYVTQFAEVGDADQVDVIAGASLSHTQFVEAVTDALSKG
ncbi:FMN-binding protein [Propionicimonas sp.]|uniref:FMN-binding protein n=1 Tax=Propionicimonas sp. TaxID=1955623 RepID=UPI0039E226DE